MFHTLYQAKKGRDAISLIAAAVAGVAVLAGFAPWAYWPLAWLGLLGLAYLFHVQPQRVWSHGLSFGLALFGCGVFWQAQAQAVAGVPWPLNMVGPLLLALLLAVIGAGLWRWLFARQVPLAFMLGWVLSEAVRELLGFPWLNLGEMWVGSALAEGWLPLVGVSGASALIACSAGLWPRRWRMAAVVTALLLLGYPLSWLRWSSDAGAAVSVSLIQTEVEQVSKWDADRVDRLLAAYYAELERSHGQVVVLPETAVTLLWHQLPPHWSEKFERLLLERGQSLFIGAPLAQPQSSSYYNSIQLMGLKPQQAWDYRKRVLVPLGEYWPMPQLLAPLLKLWQAPMSQFVPGADQQPVLSLAGTNWLPTICFESAFTELFRPYGQYSGVLLNLTNDAWFEGTLGAHQHLAIARARAIEVARPLARAGNRGLSAAVDHRGRLLAQAPLDRAARVEASLQPQRGQTPYSWWGRWPLLLVVLAVAIAAVLQPRLGQKKH